MHLAQLNLPCTLGGSARNLFTDILNALPKTDSDDSVSDFSSPYTFHNLEEPWACLWKIPCTSRLESRVLSTLKITMPSFGPPLPDVEPSKSFLATEHNSTLFAVTARNECYVSPYSLGIPCPSELLWTMGKNGR